VRDRVYRRGRSWYVDYTCGRTGRRVRRVLPGVTSERDALKRLGEIQREQDAIRRGVTDGRTNRVRVSEVVEAYLLHCLSTHAAATTRSYAIALGHTLGQWRCEDGRRWPPEGTSVIEAKTLRRTWEAGALRAVWVSELLPSAIEEWVAERRARQSVATLNLRVIVTKACLRWAERVGLIAANPLANVRRPGKARPRQRYLTAEDVERLVSVSEEPWASIWLFLASTGLRWGEFKRLRWGDLDLVRGALVVRGETSKSGRTRWIPLSQRLKARLMLLARRRQADEFVWQTKDGEPLPRHRVVRALQRAARKAGIRNVSLHTFRHTFASLLLSAGESPKVVADLLGHASIRITCDVYGHLMPRSLQAAIERLPLAASPKEPAGHKRGTAKYA